MIDSHCHLQFAQYDKDRKEVVGRALASGVKMICVGTDIETSGQAIDLAEKNDGIWTTVGLHPNDKIVGSEFIIDEYKKLTENKKVVAIGEVGLDYYRIVNPAEKQKDIFKQFIELSLETKLPLVVHSRDSSEDLLAMLEKYFAVHNSTANGVIHSFTGSAELASQYMELGFYIGLNGIITFSEEYADMVSQIPLDRILLETDAPFLAPPPFRGKRNEPLYVKYVAERIAEIKEIPIKTVIDITTRNTQELFKL